MPQLAAFPKAYMQQLCVTGEMSLREWIELASTLDIDGLEMYAGIRDLQGGEASWSQARRIAADHDLVLPMLCCSPDFSNPDVSFRRTEIDKQREWIDMTAALGGTYCRVLSGQRRPEVSIPDGLKFVRESIETCLDYATPRGIVLILENHYKDDFWKYPEFAQKKDVFKQLVDSIHHPNFGVNYDPSNAILAGDDPIELLEMVKHRVVTMHASDRYLAEGTLEDLRREEDSIGYAKRLRHGTIGEGMNDYDRIFSILSGVGFDSWISIEDGVDGIDQLRRSVTFLREKIAKYW
jgi:sugar phosphate isomerase/epimerase